MINLVVGYGHGIPRDGEELKEHIKRQAAMLPPLEFKDYGILESFITQFYEDNPVSPSIPNYHCMDELRYSLQSQMKAIGEAVWGQVEEEMKMTGAELRALEKQKFYYTVENRCGINACLGDIVYVTNPIDTNKEGFYQKVTIDGDGWYVRLDSNQKVRYQSKELEKFEHATRTCSTLTHIVKGHNIPKLIAHLFEMEARNRWATVETAIAAGVNLYGLVDKAVNQHKQQRDKLLKQYQENVEHLEEAVAITNERNAQLFKQIKEQEALIKQLGGTCE